MKSLLLWAFVAGLLNGVLLRIWDFIMEKERLDADQSIPK